MKKVLLSAYACVPNLGSEQATGWTYASTLSRNGLEVHCLTLRDGQAVIDPILADGYFPNLIVHYVLLPGWVDRFYSKSLFGMYFHYLYWQWAAYRVARQLDQIHRFDLVHHVTYGSIQLGSFLYKLGKPFIFGPVSGGQQAPKALKRYFGKYWSREWMRDRVSLLLQHLNPGFYESVKRADYLVVTNEDTHALARRLRPTLPIHKCLDVGLNGAFVPRQAIEHQPGGTLRLLWVGRLLPRKALELTLHAFSQVNPHLPITLTVVGGKGEMAELMPGYLERYGLKDRVKWIGHVTYQEVRRYYAESDVFFFTSLRDSGPHQLAEAMAHSLPLVTLDLHGQGEVVTDATGIRVPVTNETEVTAGLARAVEWMYHHPHERLAMGRAAYEFALTQVWDEKIKLFLNELYPVLLAPEPAPQPAPDLDFSRPHQDLPNSQFA